MSGLTLFIGLTTAHADVQAPMPDHGVHVVSMIAQHEQYTLVAYYFSEDERRRGIATCGFGRTVGVKAGDICPIGKELQWLAAHVKETAGAVWAASGRSLNCNQLAATTSFVYNVGLGAFQRSTMRKLILEGRMEEAGKELLKWDKQAGVALKGLTKRRQAEYRLWVAPPTNCKK